MSQDRLPRQVLRQGGRPATVDQDRYYHRGLSGDSPPVLVPILVTCSETDPRHDPCLINLS